MARWSTARAITGGTEAALVACPHDRRERIGTVRTADAATIDAAIASATAAAHGWDRLGGEARAAILDKAADLYERDRARLMAVIVREAGKTFENAQGDLREAVDFLRYYATEARRLFSRPTVLHGPTGETNTLELRGRGPFACISPWNFPIAIFTGQVAAALAAGNPVLAKPAAQTPVTAFLATQLLHEAGVPANVLHLLTGGGEVGAALVKDKRVKGIAFTGSNDTAWAIQKGLADRRSEIVPFIAETGGMNAMIVDSSALPEQVVRDAVRSAFDSAGQRCSATRVMFIQDDVADKMIEMLVGAVVGARYRRPVRLCDRHRPGDRRGRAGPARSAQGAHASRSKTVLVDLAVPAACRAGTYVGPAVYEIERIGQLEREVFGPILHVVRFAAGRPRQGGRGDQRHRLRPDARRAQPHRRRRRLRRRARPRRQSLRQPQPDRRRGRRAAVRRRRPVRHRSESRRPELPRPLRHRARAHDRHHRHRRQRAVAGLGWGAVDSAVRQMFTDDN